MAKEKVINPFDKKVLLASKGYNPTFIDNQTMISLEVLHTSHKKLLPEVEGNDSSLLNYSNLSVWYNKKRKVPFVSAYNIDGNLKTTVNRASSFKPDPRIRPDIQLSDQAFYDLVTNITEFEIGHMASHNEMAWGSALESKVRSFQTFHFTNSVPQVERLNSGLWSKLESYIIKETKDTGSKKIAVFTGPMLKDTDPVYLFDKSFKVPLFFFKVVVFNYKDKLYATGFVMSQYKRAIELGLIASQTQVMRGSRVAAIGPFMDYNYRDVFQVNISTIEAYTGLSFKWPKVQHIVLPGIGEKKLQEIAESGSMRGPSGAIDPEDPVEGGNHLTQGKITNMILPGKRS